MTKSAKIDSLEQKVDLVLKQFDTAMSYHEAWKPMHFDKELHERMGKSYATNTFNVINSALRREMILALMRIWDKTKGAVDLEAIIQDLRRENTVKEFTAHRFGIGFFAQELRESWDISRIELFAMVGRYGKNGECATTLANLRRLRHEQLAHAQVAEPRPFTIMESEIERFYQDTAGIVELLLSVVKATSYDTNDTAKIFRGHAELFWAGVRGERTAGHPNFRPPRNLSKPLR